MQKVNFFKMHGCGNNFIVLSDLKTDYDWQKVSAKILDKNYGLGTDGLMVVKQSKKYDFEVCMYNPDGSLMGMCGNGIRCVANFLKVSEIIPRDKQSVSFEVEGREINCAYPASSNWVRVDMGLASLAPESLPVKFTEPAISKKVEFGGREFEITCVSMGNPHCVIFDTSAADIDLTKIGPVIENAEIFPKRTNVEFVKVVSRQTLEMYVWERGAGITLACGTGACATLVAAVENKLCDTKAKVILPGGEVEVEYQPDTKRVYLNGPAEVICRGEFDMDYFSK